MKSEPNKRDELKEKISKLDYKIIEDKGNYKIVQKLSDNLIEAIMAVIDTYTQAENDRARIDERLVIRERINAIHYKYPNDDANSDRLFRNDFMNMFSEYMKETTEMVNQLKDSKEIE